MITTLLLLFALPPQAPMPPQAPDAPTPCLLSGCPCGCRETGRCDCLARAVPHKTYAEWKAAAGRKRAARAVVRPYATLPAWGTPPAFASVPFGGTFSSFGGACAGGG